MRGTRNVLGAVLGGVAAAAVAAAPSPAEEPGAQAAAACAKVNNVEAIIDDSGSMSLTDPNRLRVQAIDLLINALPAGTQIGAVEFGSSFDPSVPSADVVFPVQPVSQDPAGTKAALDAKIQSDNGSTDYNAAFTTGRSANPAAQARIFLTDGAHNEGTYNNTHLNPTGTQTPTYVIGFGTSLTAPEDQQRLQKIADDTGGKYFPLADASALQPVMNEIETRLSCQSPPKRFNDTLAQGKAKTHQVPLTRKAKSAQIALSWPSPLDRFTIKGVRIVRGGKLVAKTAKVGKLKVKVHKGSTFAVVKITRLVKGKLRFTVKAAKIGSGQPKVTLTTQVSQTRRK
jgi:hypothetical protein